MKLKASLSLIFGLSAAVAASAGDLVIATVNNGHMIEMQKLTPHFEKANPDIKVKWVTLEEGMLRSARHHRHRHQGRPVRRDDHRHVRDADLGQEGLAARRLKPDAAYDVDDLLPAMRNGLSVDGKLYAAPFYGESSMLMYRKDLTDKAGIKFAERPTWNEVRDAAAKIHDPKNGVYGICLRGKPGWGDNMAFLSTMANSFGAQWFDMSWKPQLESKPWKDAVTFYVDLLKKYGPPGLVGEQLQRDPGAVQRRQVRHVDRRDHRRLVHHRPEAEQGGRQGGLRAGPVQRSRPKGANWLWAWALAIPAGTKNADAAQKFITWATSKDYINLVAKEKGWAAVPTGTRKSTYANPEFLKAAKFAAAEKKAIDSANPNDSTLPKSPYVGVQFAAIPEFQAIGIAVGQQMSAALAGKATVDAALKASQAAADREMRKGGYYK